MSQYPSPGDGVEFNPGYPAGPPNLAYGQPLPGQPVSGQPGYGPGHGQPGDAQPGYAPSGDAQPMYAPPMYAQPAYGGPTPYAYLAPQFPKPTGWFVVNWLFFWPTALYSLLSHWNKIDPALYVGDVAGAQFHAGKVKTHGVIALCIFGGLMVLYVIFFIVLFSTIISNAPGN